MDRYSSALIKDGLLDKGGPSLKKAIRKLNHQAKRREPHLSKREREDWKK